MSYIGNQPLYQAFITDSFSGTGSQTVFTMSVAPANPASVLVAISGVLQDPSTYSVAGTTLTFSGAPPTGTTNISVRYLGIPASGVTTTAYRTQTEFTATAGQTVFTPPSYTSGYIDVYRNGVKLGSADYTATNGTTVTLISAATAGDLITTVSMYVSSVLNAIPATAGAVNSTYLAANLTLTTPTLNTPVLSNPNTTGTPTGVGVLTSGTVNGGAANPLTTGTVVDFTGIPSWAKRITVMLSNVSTNGASNLWIQLGTSGGIVSSGYLGSATYAGNLTAFSSSFVICNNMAAGSNFSGHCVITNITGNTWVESGIIMRNDASANGSTNAGYIALASTLTTVRITSTTPDTFDAGSINILYE